MPIQLILPTPDVLQRYVEYGSIASLPATPEETAICAAIENNKKKSMEWPYTVAVDLTIDPRLADTAKAYFDEAKMQCDPQVQAVLFCKARELAREVRTVYPTLEPLIAESIFEEALACEKAAQNTFNDKDKFSWILRGAQTITPNPKEITDRILDPLHVPAKYVKGSELWETAAKLALSAPIPFNTWLFGLKDDPISRMDFTVLCYEAAANCSQRAFLLYRSDEPDSASIANTRLLNLLKSAVTTLKMIKVQSGPSAGLQGKIVEMLEWQHHFRPESKERTEKISKKHLKAAERFSQEALNNKEQESELLLRQAIHIHSAARLAPSLEKKIELMKQSLSLAVAFKEKFPTLTHHPLFNTQPWSLSESYHLPWVWSQELADYIHQLQNK